MALSFSIPNFTVEKESPWNFAKQIPQGPINWYASLSIGLMTDSSFFYFHE